MKFKYSIFNPTPYEAHMVVYGKIMEGSKVLDVGCATGYFAKKLKEKKCKVWGIERDKEAAEEAGKYCEEVIVADLEALANTSTPGESRRNTPGVSLPRLPFQKDFFDYILLLDVLEHLKNPEKLIGLLKPFLKQNSLQVPPPQGSTSHTPGVSLSPGKIIISVPNIAHVSIRLRLLQGKFDYERVGIMDETHLRFFTQKTLKEFISLVGLKLDELDYSSDFGQLPFIGRIARKMPKIMQYRLTKMFPTLLTAQFIAVCSNSSTSGESLYAGHPRGVFKALL